MDLWQIVWGGLGMLIAVVGLLFTIYKFGIGQKDKRHTAHEEKFKEHAARFSQHETRIEGNEKEIRDTRDVLHRDYARVDQLIEMEKKLLTSMSELHQRMGGMSKALNQTIGEMNANRSNEMEQMLSKITSAIKDK